ncbi:MAG: Cna B-type domain-containing protein [Oscillospiraceae bacterium]|nr:Cna B-type domain-containing protein [Oscillospiraceae bacterium]
METNLEKRMKKYARQHKQRKIWHKILSVLSAVVVFCTTYALILPAITQERETFCGVEEHIHSEECAALSEEVLVCEIPEKEAHFHSEECFEKVLICETEENHLHTEECFAEETIICGKTENHLHTEECFENLLICELPEEEGHIHNEECYEIKTVSCEIDEHSHNLECYSDKTADIETEEQWKAGFASAQLSETVSENLITIAKSQLGYHESTKNYIVLEDGETIKGRTRYGEWFGKPYDDWNIIFAGFCLEYAEVEIPFDADIEKWIELLSAPEKDIYKPFGGHEALAGDLIFFDEDRNGKPEKAGIIIEIAEDGYKTVIGDYGDSVQSVKIEKNDETIFGFAEIAIPSPYKCGLEEHIHEEKCFDEEGNVFCGFAEHSHSDECLSEITAEPEKKPEEIPEEPIAEYICGFFEHAHSEGCFDENENLICEDFEHAHSEECIAKEEAEYFCGLEEHLHDIECFDEEENLICEKAEHSHTEDCQKEFFCGFEEHTHTEECSNEDGKLICEIEEHTHTDECKLRFEDLPEEEKLRVEQVITMIDELPTADEIEEKIMEFEEAEDYEGEEVWLTEIYKKVSLAYKYYSDLPENHRRFVTNSEKLMELEFIWSAAVLVEMEIAETITYNANMFTETAAFVVYTQGTNGYYAFDGNGTAVPINIDSEGVITANVNNRNELLWSFTKEGTDTYIIRNLSSGRYMHAYPNNGSGVTTSGAYSSRILTTNGGVRIRSNSEYAYLDENAKVFKMTQSQNTAAVYNFGIYDSSGEIYVWIDGTNGGMDYLSGSDDTLYTVAKGESFILPENWKTPDRYSYKVRGWYDIINEKYYLPGDEITPERSTVFYADWIPATYNIGQFNAATSPTVSTNDFITTKVFDYSPFFNFPYVTGNITVNASGHNETWAIDSTQKGAENLIFRDWSGGKLSYPSNSDNGDNKYTGDNTNANLLTDEVKNLIFGTGNAFDPATGTGVMGKTYLGTGDHLFQYCDDPANTEYYGYYYYDSLYHAASYNQNAQRFYVYDYLERAVDSSTADFLPFNSPYVNTNGRPVGTYSNSGQYGEYNGITHYQYTGGSGVNSEYWFGIQTDIKFFLANDPGGKDSEGNNVNQGLNGEDLVFEFTGDDDVWVFVDGILVLDIGGIHNALEGSINFATGVVTVNGNTSALPDSIGAGEHTLTMYYLERGASASNCKVKFNITTRYGLKLQKEDVLTRELLNGAVFSVFTDEACSVPAQLWESEASYKNGDAAKNAFRVSNGYTYMWGLAAGNTYYIKETEYPDNGYGAANGIIVMKINSMGTATFDVIPDPNADVNVSGGFTVHGYKIDVENHEVYLVATNGNYGDETTSVLAMKKWKDDIDHSGDSVTVYLIANGKRIREEVLNEANGWRFEWDNLPLYNSDGTEVAYDVEEGTVPGYLETITVLETSTTEVTEWIPADSIQSGKTYMLRTSSGYLSASDGAFRWITDQDEAAQTPGAKWNVRISSGKYYFTNAEGQNIYYSNSYFRAGTSSATGFTLSNGKLSYRSGWTTYYVTASLNNGRLDRNSNSGYGATFTFYEETTRTETIVIEGKGFLITNEPITEENTVSVKVKKKWDTGSLATEKDYEQLNVTVKLITNGTESGMTAVLNLKNGWEYTFENLPVKDNKGNNITYSVEEVLPNNDWSADYGGLVQTGTNSYEITVTNTYRLHYKLPETGGSGNLINIIGGIMLLSATSALIYRQTHQRKRRKEEDSS